MLGGRLMWQLPVEGLQAGGSFQALRFDLDFTPSAELLAQYEMQMLIPPDFDGNVSLRVPIKLWVLSAEYQWHGLLLAAEYGRVYGEYETNLLLPQSEVENHNGYLMASYQVTPWFTPGLYYSALLPNVDAAGPKNRSSYQHDVALTLRYDITPHWLVKLEGHFMHGTAGLNAALNEVASVRELEENWGAFLVKTTGYF
jgi:predicted porin